MTQVDFLPVTGAESDRFSVSQCCLGVEPLDEVARRLPLGTEPVDQQRAIGAQHARNQLQYASIW